MSGLENVMRNEVTKWTVALFQGDSVNPPFRLTDCISVNLSVRAATLQHNEYYELNQRRLASGSDEAIDLSSSEFSKALEATNSERARLGKKNTKTPSPPNIRRARPATKGLLMIYLLELHDKDNDSEIRGVFPSFMVSFSESVSSLKDTVVTYQLNAVAEKEFRKRLEGAD